MLGLRGFIRININNIGAVVSAETDWLGSRVSFGEHQLD